MASLRPTIQIRPELSFLVSLAHETNFRECGNLPEELYRPESIATAVSVGEGSVFAVSRQKVPRLKPFLDTIDMSGWSVTTTIDRNLLKELEWVAYKVAQVEFTEDSLATPDHRHRLGAVLVELLVLTHQPVRKHPFLPSLYGFAWAQNRFLSQQRIPVPVVDWANAGSLDVYQCHNVPLTCVQKKRIAWQVGSALRFLHDCEIYHGDVKTENILLYRNQDGSLDSKLADFGMSVVSRYGYLKYLPPGTLLWAAPEIRWTTNVHLDLAKADVFSYGLLVWRLFSDGQDPLWQAIHEPDRPCCPNDQLIADVRASMRRLDDNELRQRIESGEVLDAACGFAWMFNALLTRTILCMSRTAGESVGSLTMSR